MRDTDAATDARAMLRRSADGLRDVRLRAPALAEAMAWRSPSADEFRRALDEWVRTLDGVAEQLERWDGELVRAAAERTRLSGAGG